MKRKDGMLIFIGAVILILGILFLAGKIKHFID